MINSILVDSGVISDNFKPSYMLLSGIAQTIYAGVVSLPLPPYTREIISLPDGGQVSLQSIMLGAESKGIITIIPGI